ncbi:MAG: PHP domain-containing protein [Armatimonadia bacterium]
MQFTFDCHVHTTRSACGENITDEWLSEQALNGFSFAVTDHSMHMYYEPEIAWALLREDSVELFTERVAKGRDNTLRYIEDIRGCNRDHMHVGVELDVMYNGQIMLADDLRDQLDIIVGGVHFLPTIAHEAPLPEIIDQFQAETLWLLEYGVDVLAHPFRILRGKDLPVDDDLVHWTVEQAQKYGAALEINSHKIIREHDVLMTRLALERGLKLAIGTDAHNTREFGGFAYHQEILQAAGVQPDQLNSVLFTLN